jgi:hypothetical protein
VGCSLSRAGNLVRIVTRDAAQLASTFEEAPAGAHLLDLTEEPGVAGAIRFYEH